MSLHNYSIFIKKGEVLFCEHEPGNTMFFINKGSVRLTKMLNDREKTLTILQRGNFFGEMSIIKSLPRTATCIAEDDTELLELNRDSFFLLVQKQPTLGVTMLKVFAERLADQSRKLQIISRSTNEAKILDTLLMKHENGDSRLLTRDSFEIKITYEELADLAGINQDECEPVLHTLVASNKIKQFEVGKYVIDNTQMIRSIIRRQTE